MHNEQCTFPITILLPSSSKSGPGGGGGEGEGPGGGGGGGEEGAVAADISVFQMEMSTRHAFLYHAYGVVCVDLACDWSIVF